MKKLVTIAMVGLMALGIMVGITEVPAPKPQSIELTEVPAPKPQGGDLLVEVPAPKPQSEKLS